MSKELEKLQEGFLTKEDEERWEAAEVAKFLANNIIKLNAAIIFDDLKKIDMGEYKGHAYHCSTKKKIYDFYVFKNMLDMEDYASKYKPLVYAHATEEKPFKITKDGYSVYVQVSKKEEDYDEFLRDFLFGEYED